MRTKKLKINGHHIDAFLLCGGYGAKVYSHNGLIFILKGKKIKKIQESDHEKWQDVWNFINIKYQNIDKKEYIEKKFIELISSL